MAFKYGGEVSTMSTEALVSERSRASPMFVRLVLPRPTLLALMQFSTTLSTVVRKFRKGLAGAYAKDLWGRLCDRSLANEAPACFAIMSREKEHHSTFRAV